MATAVAPAVYRTHPRRGTASIGSQEMQRSSILIAVTAATVAACGPSAPGSQAPAAKGSPSSAAAPNDGVAAGDWPLINRNLAANRYSPLTEINAGNVAKLASSWTFQLGGNSSAVPIVVGGILYVPSRDRVVALDGDTGATVWTYQLPAAAPAPTAGAAPAAPAAGAAPARPGGPGGPGAGGPTVSARGVSYWPGDGTLKPRILFMSRANLIALDAERGIAYLPIAGPAANYYGGDRPGNNVFGNSIVAVEAATGKYLWHFQTVHHDLWDTDMPSGGSLFEFMQNGERVPAIAQVGKSSFFYVLNRLTGEPLIPVEEKPVPRGDVPTEWYSPTQPIPVRPPPLARVSFTEADLVTADDTTPEHAAACREFMKRSGGFYNAGAFTPFGYKAPDAPPKSYIQFPGGTGGVNWGGVAADPTTGVFYAASHDGALVGWVQDKDPNVTYSFEAVGSKQPYDRASIDGVGPFHTFSAPISGKYDERGRPVGPSAPCQRPPWGRLLAVNANTGEILWQSTLGIDESLPPGKQHVGNSGSAGPSVTAGGLVFVGSTSDRRFRAFDAKTGAELWSATLSNNANANPMSYAGKSGKQRVAVVSGDTVNAFGLP